MKPNELETLARETATTFITTRSNNVSRQIDELEAQLLAFAAKVQAASGAFNTSEEYFADKDLFCRYVHNEVNPARLKEGLSVFNDSAINRLYDIAMNGTHRLAIDNARRAEGSDERGSVDGPDHNQANDILGKPGHYQP